MTACNKIPTVPEIWAYSVAITVTYIYIFTDDALVYIWFALSCCNLHIMTFMSYSVAWCELMKWNCAVSCQSRETDKYYECF